MNREEVVMKFVAYSGNRVEYTIIKFQEYSDTMTSEGVESVEGLAHYETEDGQAVNRKSKGAYEIVTTGTALHSSDPSAP